MPRITRRDCLQTGLQALGAAGLAVSATGNALAGPDRQPPASRPGIHFAHMVAPGQPARLRLLKQIGVNYAIAGVAGELGKVPRDQYLPTLRRIKADFLEQGISIAGVESHPVPAEKIKLGLPGRDEEIENYKAAIDALGRAEIPVLCYNWMAGLGWYRTGPTCLSAAAPSPPNSTTPSGPGPGPDPVGRDLRGEDLGQSRVLPEAGHPRR